MATHFPIPFHPSHRRWRHSPVGESSLPSRRRSCHTSPPNPVGLNAVTWVTAVPAWGREKHHHGLLLWRRFTLSTPQYHHQDIALTSHVLPSNSNAKLVASAALLTPSPERLSSGKTWPHSWCQARAENPNLLYAHPFPAACRPLPHIQQGSPAGATAAGPALYLLPGRDGQGEGVHGRAVVQQDSSNPLSILLEGEGLVPVPAPPVLLCSRAVLQAEHDGHFHILIPAVLHLPDEHSHWQAGVLAQTQNAVYRAAAPQAAAPASFPPLLGTPRRMQ